MHVQISPAVSFCFVEDRPVFLDRAADRYFMLGGEAERSFVKLTKGEDLTPNDREALSSLFAQGILREAETSIHVSPCVLLHDAALDIDDLGIGRRSSIDVLGIVTRMVLVRRRLKRGGLDKMLRELDVAKSRIKLPSSQPLDCSGAISSSFQRANLVSRSRDRCLSRSLVIASRLIDAGVPCNLIIGVQLGPFQAHCWVQHKQYVVGDRTAYVSEFTPILVL